MSADPRIGSELAGYRIESLLGRGGMSVVYLAEDLALERKVALKLLAPELAEDERFRERFLSESRIAASIDHPNVIPIYGAGEADGTLFIAMRYVEGTDLRELLDSERKLEPARAVSIITQTAHALDVANARGLVHRDVKPGNILIASGAGPEQPDHVYLSDFGLTKHEADGASLTETGQFLGTIDYVAPEQIDGKELDGRADEYSLACVLYECLTGEVPYRNDSQVAVLYSHLQQEPPQVSERDPTLPGGLDAIVAKGMAKEPDERYDTSTGLANEVRQELGMSGEYAPDIAAPKRRSRFLVVAGILLALAAAGLSAGLVVAFTSGTDETVTGDRLLRIDPATNEVVESVPVGEFPSSVAVGAGHVWVTSFADDTLIRINPNSGDVVTVEANGGHDVAVSGSIAYVADAVGVTRFAAENVTVQDSVRTQGTTAVASGEEGVWIAQGENPVGMSAASLGPAFGIELQKIVPVPQERSELERGQLWDIAVGEGSVWLVSDVLEPWLWRVDPDAGEISATISLPSMPGWVAAGAGAVWVSGPLDDVVWRVDPAMNEVTATVEVGRGAAGIAAGPEGVWVANSIDATVTRIDPETNEVVATVSAGRVPVEVAVGDGAVWVTDQPSRASAGDANSINVGHLSGCTETFAQFYDATVAGAELPLLQRGGRLTGPDLTDGVTGVSVGGRPLQLSFGCSFDSYTWGLIEARRLVESVGVEVLVGPLAGGVGIALREYAKRHPEVTFVNGTAGTQSATLREPASNFFRFSTDSAQWIAGLGSYAYNELGWRSAVVVEDDYDFGYVQSAGFIAEFCSLGGEILTRIQRPIATADYSSALAEIPADTDGVFASVLAPSLWALVSSDHPLFDGELADRIVGGTLLYNFLPEEQALADRLIGIAAGNSVPRGFPTPAWEQYVEDFREAFPELIAEQLEAGVSETSETSLFAIDYYIAMEAALQALEAVGGDLSDSQRFQAELASLELDSPIGRIALDGNRQAVGPVFLEKLDTDAQGNLVVRTFRTVDNVEQTFNGYFAPDSLPPGRDQPECRPGSPPPWAVAGG